MLELRPTQADGGGSTAAPNKERSPTSVIEDTPGSGAPALDVAQACSPLEATAALAKPNLKLTVDGSDCSQAGGAQAAVDTADGLTELRALGRQLLLGWSEALAALCKLPGVGSMRVEALAARLHHLASEASPVGAAAAASSAAAAGAASSSAAPTSTAPSGAEAGLAPGSAGSRGSTPPLPPTTELAGPACHPQQAYSDPADMFATAAKSAHLSYPELLHAFAASAEGLDDEALADYLFNLAMLCAEPADNELVVRPVLSLPQNSEEQQQYRRRQAAGAAAPVDAMLAAMSQQQAGGGGGGGAVPRSAPAAAGVGGGLTHEAIWQQIVAQQQQPQAFGRLAAAPGGRGVSHLHSPARSKSDMLASYQQALADPQVQGLLRGAAQPAAQFAAQQHQQHGGYAAAPGLVAPMSPTRGLQSSGSPLAKAVSMPERDLWLTAASLASEAEQKQQEAAAAAAAAASASFSFHPQPPSPTFGRMPQLPASSSAGGSGLWSSSTGGSGSISRSGGSGGGGVLRTLSDLSY